MLTWISQDTSASAVISSRQQLPLLALIIINGKRTPRLTNPTANWDHEATGASKHAFQHRCILTQPADRWPACPEHLLLRPRTASSWLLPCREQGWWPKHWISSPHQLHLLHCKRFEAVSEQRGGTEELRASLMFPHEPYQNEWHTPAENLPSLRFLVTHFLLFSPSLRNWDRLKLPTHYGKNIRFYKPRKEGRGEQVQGGGGREKYVTLSLFFLLLFLTTIPWFSTRCLVYQHYFCLFIILWSVSMLVMATTSKQTHDEIKIKRREKRWGYRLLSWSDFYTDLQK